MSAYYKLGDTITEARYIVGNNPERWTPVVVIDPEDRDTAKDLANALAGVPVEERFTVDAVQNVLREFANPTPPKPEEPDGLGAVVEDGKGVRWVRVAGPDLTFAWRQQGHASTYDDNHYWHEVPAVRVLSEGVTE